LSVGFTATRRQVREWQMHMYSITHRLFSQRKRKTRLRTFQTVDQLITSMWA